jgi:hypothetical protein
MGRRYRIISVFGNRVTSVTALPSKGLLSPWCQSNYCHRCAKAAAISSVRGRRCDRRWDHPRCADPGLPEGGEGGPLKQQEGGPKKCGGSTPPLCDLLRVGITGVTCNGGDQGTR